MALAAIRRANRGQIVIEADLAAAAVPTLGTVGTDDPCAVSFAALARAVPRLLVRVIDGATHDDAPVRPGFLRAVQEFLRERSATP